MTNALWYWARGLGVSSMVLLSLVMVLGILTRGGASLPGLSRYVVASVHRTLALSAVVFIGLHVVLLFSDPYAQLRLVDLIVPFDGAYHPLWLGLGTLALDAVLLLVISSVLRDRLGPRTWRAVHWIAYACWPLAVLHGLGNGTDAATAWYRWTTFVCVASVCMAIAWRLLTPRTAAPRPPRRVAAPVDLALPR
jgi:sulfoxide reductase heme-binding subunit YedZ